MSETSRADSLKAYIIKNDIFKRAQLAKSLDMDYVNFYNWTIGKRRTLPESKLDKLEKILKKYGYESPKEIEE